MAHRPIRKTLQSTSEEELIRPFVTPEGTASLSAYCEAITQDITFTIKQAALQSQANQRSAIATQDITVPAGTSVRSRIPLKHRWVWLTATAAAQPCTAVAEIHQSPKHHLHVATHTEEESDGVLIHGISTATSLPQAVSVNASGEIVSATDFSGLEDDPTPAYVALVGGKYEVTPGSVDDGDLRSMSVTSTGEVLVTGTDLSSIDSKIIGCNTGDVTVSSSVLPTNAATDSAENDHDAPVGTTGILVGGRAATSVPADVNDGDFVHAFYAPDGAQVTRQRCQEVTLPDGISNTNREVKLSCAGNYIADVPLNLVFNGTSWDRMRGNASDGIRTYNSLQHYRSNGQCFSTPGDYTNASLVGDVDFALFGNNSGETKTCLVYRIIISMSDDNAASAYTAFNVNSATVTTGTGGTKREGRCLKLGESDADAGYVLEDPASGFSKVALLEQRTFTDPNTTGGFRLDQVLDYPEFIEVPPGYGLVFNITQAGANASSVQGSVTVNWIEV